MNDGRNNCQSQKGQLSPYLLKLPTNEILSKFVHCQWLDGKKHDWTEQVKCDLANDLDLIQNKSVFSWKNLVKKKARAFELVSLVKLKEA